ncbi:hypothetical protein HMPREF9120_01796 [Neisseria sp. oral taxon 020 str. F0370]|nr:hypothetical protein HMPREF9120_01796 [Neisseria sp. oral taxon 020 str. F0370]
MQGKKRSKVGHLASIFDAAGGYFFIFDAAGADFYQKYRRKADCQQTLGRQIIVAGVAVFGIEKQRRDLRVRHMAVESGRFLHRRISISHLAA